MFRILIAILIVLYFVYSILMLLHLVGLLTMTSRKVRLWRIIIPFYYWIAPVNERKKKNKNNLIKDYGTVPKNEYPVEGYEEIDL